MLAPTTSTGRIGRPMSPRVMVCITLWWSPGREDRDLGQTSPLASYTHDVSAVTSPSTQAAGALFMIAP